MLKHWRLSATLIVAILIAGVLIVQDQSSIIPVPPDQYAECKQAAQEDKANHLHCEATETRWERTRDDPVSYYSLWLTAFTAVLALIGIFQGVILIRTDKTARISADAARRAADALPTVERAHVYPIITNPGAVEQILLDSAAFYLDEGKDDVRADLTMEVTFQLKNFGKTPAVIIDVFASVGTHPLGGRLGILCEDSVLGYGESTRDMTATQWRGLTRSDVHHIRTYTKHFSFAGLIRFKDIWDEEYLTDFEFAWEPQNQRWQLAGLDTKHKEGKSGAAEMTGGAEAALHQVGNL